MKDGRGAGEHDERRLRRCAAAVDAPEIQLLQQHFSGGRDRDDDALLGVLNGSARNLQCSMQRPDQVLLVTSSRLLLVVEEVLELPGGLALPGRQIALEITEVVLYPGLQRVPYALEVSIHQRVSVDRVVHDLPDQVVEEGHLVRRPLS